MIDILATYASALCLVYHIDLYDSFIKKNIFVLAVFMHHHLQGLGNLPCKSVRNVILR